VGRPILYGTTPEFLSYMGVNDLADLPELKELGSVLEERERLHGEVEPEGEASPPGLAAPDAADATDASNGTDASNAADVPEAVTADAASSEGAP
jgi:segregation and condensation protein B